MNNEQKTTVATLLPRLLVNLAVIAFISWYALNTAPSRSSSKEQASKTSSAQEKASEEEVIPSAGVKLLIRLGDLGTQMTKTGVIDKEKFLALYAGEKKNAAEGFLYGTSSEPLVITRNNAPIILNLLWALGLGNKNPILEQGPMVDPQYKGAGNFASTGGWTLARGDAMGHYSKYALVPLNAEQQALVERVSKGIYRPCCNNPTYFPDCNHGMAMLGLLELLASQGASETEMYRTALTVNAYWFPDTYLTIAKYLTAKGMSWKTADPKILLGVDYSSASGFRKIAAQVEPIPQRGGSCGV